MLNKNTEWINGEDLEQVEFKQAKWIDGNGYTFVRRIQKGDWFGVNGDLLINDEILYHAKFIKKEFHYKNKLFQFLHLPKWKLFGWWRSIYEWLG